MKILYRLLCKWLDPVLKGSVPSGTSVLVNFFSPHTQVWEENLPRAFSRNQTLHVSDFRVNLTGCANLLLQISCLKKYFTALAIPIRQWTGHKIQQANCKVLVWFETLALPTGNGWRSLLFLALKMIIARYRTLWSHIQPAVHSLTLLYTSGHFCF